MIIGIDASRANHNRRTGVEEYAFQLIQNLKIIIPEDVRVILYTDKPLQGELAKLPVNWTEKLLHWTPGRLWTQVRLSWEMFWHSPDVLFIPAHVFSLIHPKKTVMTVHDIAAVRFPESYNWFEKWYSVWSAKYAVEKLWQVIVPSEFVKKEILEFFSLPDHGKIKVIPHGFDRNFLDATNILDHSQKENKLKKYNITKPFIVSVGRLEEKKNTVGIIEAFNNLQNSNLKLVLIGKPGYGYEKVQAAIEKSPNQENIIIPGWVSRSDLPGIMSLAEVFVFPSFYEGFGLPVLEAFACGLPVVASEGYCLEEVGGQACLYVDPKDVTSITKSIEKVLNDTVLKQKMVTCGLDYLKNFSWEKSAKETWSLLMKSCDF